jgi:alpha-beta hydrolase superfamily lysophospholipase
MLQSVRVNPAASYDEALERVRALQALDDECILPKARTALLDHGARTSLVVVLLHGFTNHPGQYRELAPLVHARGANVLVPRMPEQGDRDRLTRRMSKLTAESLLARATEAVDIACGLGERVCVAGISSSGLLCAYFAQHRPDVARAIAIAPVFAMLQLPYAASFLLTRAMLILPDQYLWWDPRVKENQRPATAYPWFSTHALAQTMRIGADLH